MGLRKETPAMVDKPEKLACPKCGNANDAKGRGQSFDNTRRWLQ